MTWYKAAGGELHGAELFGVVQDDELLGATVKLIKDKKEIKSTIVGINRAVKFSGIQEPGNYIIVVDGDVTAKQTVNVSHKDIVDKKRVDFLLSIYYATITLSFQSYDFRGQTFEVHKGANIVKEYVVSNSNDFKLFINDSGEYNLKFGENKEYEKKFTITNEELSNKVEKTIDVLPFKIVSWSSGSTFELEMMLEAHYAGEIDVSDYWSIGDIRTVYLTSNSKQEAQKAEFIITDFKHDTITDSNGIKAAVVIHQLDCLEKEMKYHNSSATITWKDSDIRKWLNDEYLSSLPSSFMELIKPVNKKTSTRASKIETTSDYIFLASEMELHGFTSYSYVAEGVQYQYFNSVNRIKFKGANRKQTTVWFERSPANYTSGSYAGSVTGTGGVGMSQATSSLGVSPFFCM